MTISSNLRQLRHSRQLTQEQVAEQLGVTRQALSSYESGRTRPDIDTLLRLAQIYGTDLDGIVYGTETALRDTKRVQAAAAVLFAVLLLLWVGSAFVLCRADLRFDTPLGQQLTQEEAARWEAYSQQLQTAEALEHLLLAASVPGFGLLLLLSLTGKHVLPLKAKLLYAGALGAGMFLIAGIFAAADPVLGLANYIAAPAYIFAELLLFLAAELIGSYLKRKNRSQTRS